MKTNVPVPEKRNHSFTQGFIFLVLAGGFVLWGCASQGSPSPGETKTEAAAPPGATDAETAQMLGLHEAVRDFSLYLDGRVRKDELSAVLSVEAPLKGMSDYITDTLTEELLNTAGARMVSRQSLETVKREQNIQAGGFVDDDTAARIGHIAGWRTVITGAVTPLASGYRMNLRAVDVESAELLGAKGYLIKSDAVLAGIVNPSQTARELLRREELLRPFAERKNDFALVVRPAGGQGCFL